MGLGNFFKNISEAASDFKRGFSEGTGSSVSRNTSRGRDFNYSSSTSNKDSYSGSSKKRRTDDEIAKNRSGMNKNPSSFQHKTGVKLSSAKSSANSEPGVYVLYLDGAVMKCGRAAYGQGIKWRFTQYYNLNYDNRARKGDCWSVNEKNRDRVVVSWQCCPEAACKELEYKLFKKYG